MAYEMNNLAGFLQIGPHYFPDRPNGAQIIMRGPHGQRLAAGTLHSNKPGSGFRWWHEDLNIGPGVEWNPQQVVTGVMGMGGLGAQGGAISDADNRKKYSLAARSLLAQANACPQSACSEIQARASGMRQTIRAYRKWETPWWSPSSLLGDGPGYDDWQVVDGNLQAAEVAASRRSEGREVPKGAQSGFVNPAAEGGKVFRREVVSNADEMVAWLKANWWKVALGVGGVVVFTGAAKGLGAGLGAGLAAKRL